MSKDILRTVLLSLASSAAQSAAYDKWSDDFSRKEIKREWADLEGSLRKPSGKRLTISDLQALSQGDLDQYGFLRFNKHLRVIPLYIWNYIQDNEPLISISGEKVKKNAELDLDVRAGCVAYGFFT